MIGFADMSYKRKKDSVVIDEISPEDSQHVSDIPILIPQKQFYYIILTISIMLAVNGIDANVLGDAAPIIAERLEAIPRISWIGAVAMISAAATILPIGLLYRRQEPKLVIVASLLLFIIGEALAGSATHFGVFVAGRVLTGVALGSTTTAGFLVVGLICNTMAERAIFISSVVALYGLMLKVGPLISGALLKDSLDLWRWCFYLQIPILGLVVMLVAIGFPRLKQKDSSTLAPDDSSTKRLLSSSRAVQITLSSVLSSVMTLSLVLPPILGGNTLSWTSGSMILMFVMAPVSIGVFYLWTRHCSSSARLVPLDLFETNKSLYGISIVLFCAIFTTFASTYFLPIYFQTVFGSSPIHSAVQILPLAIFGILAVVVVGKIAEKTGSYVYSCYAGSLLHILSGGLFYLVAEDTSLWKIYVLEALLGIGAGSLTAIGNVVAFDNVPSNKFAGIVAWMNYLLVIAAALGIGIQGALLTDQLRKALVTIHLSEPGFTFNSDIVGILRSAQTDSHVTNLLRAAIVQSQKQASLMYLVSGVLSFAASCSLEHKRL